MVVNTLETIAEALQRAVDADLAVILGQEDSGHLRVLAVAGPLASPRFKRLLVDPSPRPALRAALTQRHPVVLDEAHQEHHEPDTYEEILELPGDHSCLVAPLWSGSERVGILTLDIVSCNFFNAETVKMVGAFADLAAAAVAEEQKARSLSRRVETLAFENAGLRADEGSDVGLVGGSVPWQRVVEQLRLVAPTGSTVLLTGETGTGKEQAARAVHRWSMRKEGPFIALNCSALAQELTLSELFGHEEGAFTGADRKRLGRFELAGGGTLFLDEVADLSATAQAQLLRVLQEQTFERVGGSETHTADVRLVAATHKDLSEEIGAGRFREDLFYRLTPFPIHLPPLRERPEDVLPLAVHLLRRLGDRLKMPDLEISLAAVRELEGRLWPGNVREMGNTLERAAIFAHGGRINPAHLDFGPEIKGPFAPGVPAAQAPPGFVLPQGLSRLDRAIVKEILAALSEADGKVSGEQGAAQRLGVPPTTLYSAITRHGLRRSI